MEKLTWHIWRTEYIVTILTKPSYLGHGEWNYDVELTRIDYILFGLNVHSIWIDGDTEKIKKALAKHGSVIPVSNTKEIYYYKD